MKKKSATSVTVPATKKNTAAAKRRRPDGTAGGGRRPKRARDLRSPSHGDLISSLPDAILEAIISLLPIKNGARTQAVARGWRPLWRSTPLDLDGTNICSNKFKRVSVVSSILRDHLGPARRFTFVNICVRKSKKGYSMDDAQIERWFHCRCLDKLEELDISFRLLGIANVSRNRYPLPSSVLRLAPTLVVATIGVCRFPSEVAASLNFPLLRELTLWSITISEEALDVLLSACHVLDTLFLEDIHDVDCLRETIPASLSHSICTVNIVALKFFRPDLNAVLAVLRCFPCLEKLYVIWDETLKAEMVNIKHASL
ncbi:hypothetical protein D1007_59500 [Hordeum vulgare]|nr:hypothetical protein D1007_59500 [Hordeum vulgare]